MSDKKSQSNQLIATLESELGARPFSIHAHGRLADRAKEFIPEGELKRTIFLIYSMTLMSLMAERKGRRVYVPGEVTQSMVRERMRLGFDLYATLRDPKQLGLPHKVATDHLPMVLRCHLDGEPWEGKINKRRTYNADALKRFADDAAGM